MIHFLNELYSFMDKQIVKYDVYKVSRQNLLLASEEAFRKVFMHRSPDTMGLSQRYSYLERTR